MKDHDEHKKIAVLIDADNAQYSKVKAILDETSAHGHVVIKRAYGDWSSDYFKNWKQALNELAIQPIQQFAYTTGKNEENRDRLIFVSATGLIVRLVLGTALGEPSRRIMPASREEL